MPHTLVTLAILRQHQRLARLNREYAAQRQQREVMVIEAERIDQIERHIAELEARAPDNARHRTTMGPVVV
jgi:hypothetical protein